ncbi:MAG: hypothetical protein ABI685_12135 [Ferruginibacter sp.]
MKKIISICITLLVFAISSNATNIKSQSNKLEVKKATYVLADVSRNISENIVYQFNNTGDLNYWCVSSTTVTGSGVDMYGDPWYTYTITITCYYYTMT